MYAKEGKMCDLTIRGREDGPYMVPGQATYLDADGEEQMTKRAGFSLCRCGGSARKPLCDGTHRRIEFKAPATEITLVE
jgi:3-phenylpropionate/trans-cinnamate dioxygenase ferredoxin subunit